MDTNLSTLAFQRESSWGTVPGSPALKKARITGETLQHEKDTAESAEIRDDRQKPDSALVGAGAGGQVKFELSFFAVQHWLEAALMGVLTALNISVTVSVSASTQVITGTAADFDDVIVGGTVKIAGFATSANNGLKRVVAKAANGSTITLAAGSITTNETSESITITGTVVRNGSTAYSYYLERKVPKTPSGYAFQRFLGMMVDKFSLDFKSKAIVTGNLTFVGKVGEVNDASLNGGTAYTAADEGEILNATSNVGTIMRDAESMSEKFKSFSIDMVNNLRGRDAIGELGNFSVGVGSFGMSGKMECYFRDNGMLADVIAHENTALSYRVTDSDGNIMVVDIPRLVFSSGNASIDKLDSDVMVPLEWKAVRDPVTDATAIFSFIEA